MNKCPLCEGTILWRGLNKIECDGPGCPNYKVPPPPEEKSPREDDTIPLKTLEAQPRRLTWCSRGIG